MCAFCFAHHSAFEPWYKLVPWFLMPHGEEVIFCGVSGLLLFFPCNCLALALFWPGGWVGDSLVIVYQLFLWFGAELMLPELSQGSEKPICSGQKKKECSTSKHPQAASQTTVTLLKRAPGSWRLDTHCLQQQDRPKPGVLLLSGFLGLPRALQEVPLPMLPFALRFLPDRHLSGSRDGGKGWPTKKQFHAIK